MSSLIRGRIVRAEQRAARVAAARSLGVPVCVCWESGAQLLAGEPVGELVLDVWVLRPRLLAGDFLEIASRQRLFWPDGGGRVYDGPPSDAARVIGRVVRTGICASPGLASAIIFDGMRAGMEGV